MSSFATLSQLKTWLSIDSSITSDDALLQQLLDGATQLVKTYCNRDFARQTYTERFINKKPGRQVLLGNHPVLTVSSFKVNGRELSVSTGQHIFGYTFDNLGIRLIGYAVMKDDWLDVTYEAGFDVIPDDLINCVMKIAGVWYKEKDRIGISSKTVQVETVTFNNNIPSDVKMVLNQYKAVWSPR